MPCFLDPGVPDIERTRWLTMDGRSVPGSSSATVNPSRGPSGRKSCLCSNRSVCPVCRPELFGSSQTQPFLQTNTQHASADLLGIDHPCISANHGRFRSEPTADFAQRHSEGMRSGSNNKETHPVWEDGSTPICRTCGSPDNLLLTDGSFASTCKWCHIRDSTASTVTDSDVDRNDAPRYLPEACTSCGCQLFPQNRHFFDNINPADWCIKCDNFFNQMGREPDMPRPLQEKRNS